MFFTIISCNSNSQKEKILTCVKDLNIKVQIADTLEKNDTVYVPVYINNTIYRLREVLFDYNVNDSTVIDTSVLVMINEGVHLAINNDTAQFWVTTGQTSGKYNSQEITFIAEEKNKLYFQKFSFTYLVK